MTLRPSLSCGRMRASHKGIVRIMVSCRDSETGMSAGSRSAYFASSPCQCGWLGYMQYMQQQLVVSEQYMLYMKYMKNMKYMQYSSGREIIGRV
jgi:hypothetical protein